MMDLLTQVTQQRMEQAVQFMKTAAQTQPGETEFQKLLDQTMHKDLGLPERAGETQSGKESEKPQTEKPKDEKKPEDPQAKPELAAVEAPVEAAPDEIQVQAAGVQAPLTVQATAAEEGLPLVQSAEAQELQADMALAEDTATTGETDIVSVETVVPQKLTEGQDLGNPITWFDPEQSPDIGSLAEEALSGLQQTADGEAVLQAEPDADGQTEIPTEEVLPEQAEDVQAEKQPVRQQAEAPAIREANPLEDEVRKADESVLGMYQPADQPRQAASSSPVQEAPKPFAPEPQAEQIRLEVVEHLRQDKMEFHMQLNPQELGRVDVRMVMEHGRLAVEITAANAKAAELLSRQTEGLAASLRAGSIQLESVQVVGGAQETGKHMDGAFTMDQFQREAGEDQASGQNTSGRAGRTNSAAEPMPQEAQEPASAPNTLLNYRI